MTAFIILFVIVSIIFDIIIFIDIKRLKESDSGCSYYVRGLKRQVDTSTDEITNLEYKTKDIEKELLNIINYNYAVVQRLESIAKNSK